MIDSHEHASPVYRPPGMGEPGKRPPLSHLSMRGGLGGHGFPATARVSRRRTAGAARGPGLHRRVDTIPSNAGSGWILAKSPVRVTLVKALIATACLILSFASPARAATPSLFDGKTFAGWEGDTTKTFLIVDGTIQAGSLTEMVPRNEFLATTTRYTNFVLRLKVKLTGTEGFVNSGVQIRSERKPQHHEMIGYQADIGAGWWGAIYDETRRNVILAKPEEAVVKGALKENEWNDYEIRAEGRRIVLKLNGVTTVDYTEKDESIPQHGLIAVQIHGGGKAVVAFKDITVEVLP